LKERVEKGGGCGRAVAAPPFFIHLAVRPAADVVNPVTGHVGLGVLVLIQGVDVALDL
jgi:hypothetical protein